MEYVIGLLMHHLKKLFIVLFLMTLSTVNAQDAKGETESVIHYNRSSFLLPVQGKIVFQDDLTIHLDMGETGLVKIRKELIRKIVQNGENVTWEYLSEAEKIRRLQKRRVNILLAILGSGPLFVFIVWLVNPCMGFQ